MTHRAPWQWLELTSCRDARGDLLVAEWPRDFGFTAKRFYCLKCVPEEVRRGGHAHRALRQVFVPLVGGFSLLLESAQRREVLRLEAGTRGLYVGPMVWRELSHFERGAVVGVFASDWYDEGDYIREYEVFRALCEGKKNSVSGSGETQPGGAG